MVGWKEYANNIFKKKFKLSTERYDVILTHGLNQAIINKSDLFKTQPLKFTDS